jgi:hypothetical protein
MSPTSAFWIRATCFVLLPAVSACEQKPPTAATNREPKSAPAAASQPIPFPPVGIAIADTDRQELTAALRKLGEEIAALKPTQAGTEDVEIFHKAVDWALRYNEIYRPEEVALARELLEEGRKRAAALREGKRPWLEQTGPSVRGFVSGIDGSVQPYGVVRPPTWKPMDRANRVKRAFWIWNHAPSETLTELAFIGQRMKDPGAFSPDDAIVVHPYGRSGNGARFAGETDVFEARDAASRVDFGGFALVNAGLGGSGTWHLGTHYSWMWSATHVGPDLSEKPKALGVFSPGTEPWWERVLRKWYDPAGEIANFANSPVVVYRRENQPEPATELLKRLAEKENIEFDEFTGSGADGYDAEIKPAIESRLGRYVSNFLLKRDSRQDQLRKEGRLVTHSLIYSTLYFSHLESVKVTGFERSWERADFAYALESDGHLKITTQNITAFSLELGNMRHPVVKALSIDGQRFEPTKYLYLTGDGTIHPRYDPLSRAYVVALTKEGAKWLPPPDAVNLGRKWESAGFSPPPAPTRQVTKNSTICGPIDHAFMSSFYFVKPTGQPFSPELGAWTQREFKYAVQQWRSVFRGDVRVVDDKDARNWGHYGNLVLWGDPSSNAFLKEFAHQLPVKWTAEGVEFGGKKYPASHVPILIFPHPYAWDKYIVLNSGPTFGRAVANGSLRQMTPKLPDWAIVDTSVLPDDKYPGKVVDAGFFDANWKFTTERPK